jgi:hypothetical protein
VFGLAELLKNIGWFMSWGMTESILCKGVIITDRRLCLPGRQSGKGELLTPPSPHGIYDVACGSAGEAPHKFTPPDKLGIFDMPGTDPALGGVHLSLNPTRNGFAARASELIIGFELNS